LGPLGGTEVKAQQSAGKGSLSHLEGTFVFVTVAESIQELGIEESTLETNVELQLRKANVTVYDKEKYSNKHPKPGILVSVKSVGTISYLIDLRLFQSVVLSNGEEANAVTYFTRVNGAALATRDMIRDDVEQVVKKFLNDWLEVH
jgi:hypothetical protein